MKRKSPLILLGLLLFSIGLFSLPMAGTQAISEVTPTPQPAEPTPVPAQPTVPPATAVPDTDMDVDATLEAGIAALQSGQFDEAVALFSQVLSADPERVNAWLGRGLAYSQLDRPDEAISDMTEAINRAPWDASIYTLRAAVYSGQRNYGEALLDYDEAVRISPFQDEAIAARAETYLALGDGQSAEIDLAIVRGLQNLRSGNPDGALNALNEAIDTGAETSAVALAHYIAAQVYGQQDDIAGIIDSYASALEINPQMHIVHLARGIFYRENGDLERAAADFAQRIRINGRETLDETIEVGEVLELEMAYQRVYSITFTGQAGSTVTLSASDMNLPVDPLIALLGPDGEPIAGDDDFGGGLNSEIDDFTLPADGTYTLLVSHAEGGRGIGFAGTIRVELTSGVDV